LKVATVLTVSCFVDYSACRSLSVTRIVKTPLAFKEYFAITGHRERMDCQPLQDCGKDSASCSPQWLADRLAFENDQDGGDLTGSETQSTSGGRVLLIDCRPNESYLSVHIRVAVNLALPTLMLRRFIKGQMSVEAVTSHLQQQQQHEADGDVIHSDLRNRTLVFYDDCTTPLPHPGSGDDDRVDANNGNALGQTQTGNSIGPTAQQQPLVIVLTQRFRQQGYDAVLLDGMDWSSSILQHVPANS
jgi:hypothetical protein